MFDSIVQTIADYPYLGVVLFFLICGLGFPLPEELVLIAGGYICAKFPDKAQVSWMRPGAAPRSWPSTCCPISRRNRWRPG